jgi:hypothetical protein
VKRIDELRQVDRASAALQRAAMELMSLLSHGRSMTKLMPIDMTSRSEMIIATVGLNKFFH